MHIVTSRFFFEGGNIQTLICIAVQLLFVNTKLQLRNICS